MQQQHFVMCRRIKSHTIGGNDDDDDDFSRLGRSWNVFEFILKGLDG
jgi:hypothetical protein